MWPFTKKKKSEPEQPATKVYPHKLRAELKKMRNNELVRTCVALSLENYNLKDTLAKYKRDFLKLQKYIGKVDNEKI